MKLSFSKLAFAACLSSLLFFSACDKKEDPNPPEIDNPQNQGGTSKINWTFMQELSWAFQEYKNVPLAYIATDIAEPIFEYEINNGYTLNFEPIDRTNEEGLPIYRVLAYMPEITNTSTNNEFQEISCLLKIKGTKNLAGQEVVSNYSYTTTFNRYLCPTAMPELLVKDWYLVISTDFAFNQWKSNYSDTAANGFVSDTATYPFDKTPIIFNAEFENDSWQLSYSNSYDTLTGWLDKSSDVEVPLELKNGFLDTSAPVLPAVYYIDETELRCMVPVYDSDGILNMVQNYIFGQYTK